MPLPQGKLMASEETQANVSSRVSRAMEDLARKAEMQKVEKEQREQEARIKEAQQKEEDELEAIRKGRIERMKREKGDEEKNKSKGHGEVTYITQDEFLPTVLGSNRCVIHFFHRQFQRCEVVDARLKTLAPLHLEARFARIDAEKAPFFVEKLKIRVLPTIVCFEDGKAIGKKVGYQGETEAESLLDIEKELVDIGVLSEVKVSPPAKATKARGGRDDDDDDDDDLMSNRTRIRVGKTQAIDDW